MTDINELRPASWKCCSVGWGEGLPARRPNPGPARHSTRQQSVPWTWSCGAASSTRNRPPDGSEDAVTERLTGNALRAPRAGAPLAPTKPPGHHRQRPRPAQEVVHPPGLQHCNALARTSPNPWPVYRSPPSDRCRSTRSRPAPSYRTLDIRRLTSGDVASGRFPHRGPDHASACTLPKPPFATRDRPHTHRVVELPSPEAWAGQHLHRAIARTPRRSVCSGPPGL
jgi:hypothetical protein